MACTFLVTGLRIQEKHVSLASDRRSTLRDWPSFLEDKLLSMCL